MEAIALAGLNRREEAMARVKESVLENPQPTWGITDQAQALNATVALCILHELDAAFEWLEKTARVFSNSYNRGLFDIVEHMPALDPMRHDGRYGSVKKEYTSRHEKSTNVELRL
jgi:hypothetical protein